VGKSTCKLLPFKLGCAYVGNKRVASKGKSKGVPRKGIIKVTKEGTTRGVIKGATK
jgi:hypothetical protein